MRNFKELDVWKKSIELTKEVYNIVKLFPKEETYALSDQLRRAVISIPSNIAEGYSRYGDKEFIKFMYIARGSTAEVETQIYIACEIGYLSEEQSMKAFELCKETNRLIGGFINRLEKTLL